MKGKASRGSARHSNRRVVVSHATETLSLNPAWVAFIRYCWDLEHGEISQLKIQDGVPVMAEEARRKIKFV